MALGGCQVGGTSTTAGENDRLRREAIDLKRQIEQRTGEVAELRVKLAECDRGRAAAMDPAVLDAIPRITKIEFGMLAGLAGKSGDPERLLVFDFATLDGRGRFTQAVGSVTVEAAAMPELGGASTEPPAAGALAGPILARRTLTPPELREAYRSGLGSASYVVEARPLAGVPESGDLVLRVSFSDALTGQTHVATKVTRLRAGR